MKFLLSTLTSCVISFSVSAQDCTQANLAKLPGSWKKGQQGSINNVTATDLVQEKAVINNIHNLLTENYKPSGCEVNYSTVFGKNPTEGSNWVSDPYYYQAYILRFLCDKNSADKTKYYTDVSTTTTVQITANAIYDMRLYAADLLENNFRGYFQLEKKPVKKDGVYYLGEFVKGDSHRKDKIMEYSWLITYDDELPFSYITRKEYLLLIKKRLEKTIKEQSNYASYFDEFKNRINEYLNKDVTYLSEPAICDFVDEERFKGFVTEGTPGSFFAIKPNLTYYRKNLKKSTPQFFHIKYKITQNDPVFEKNIAGLMKALDFEKLRSMLGKDAGTATTQIKQVQKPNSISSVKETKQTTSTFNLYQNTATPGFKSTPVAAIKREVISLPPINANAKAKALSLQLTEATIPGYLNQLLTDVESKLTSQQKTNTALLYKKLMSNPVELADAGVMLYYKGALNESLWCLSKASAMRPGSLYILNNLTGILNLADAPARSLPILRYLNTKLPQNSTVLNNLGQALFELGETTASRSVLDSCIRIYAFHSQANATRAVIADKEGKTAESVKFVEKSLKGAYSDKVADYAKRKNIKIDYSNILNRYRPTTAEYVNPRKFIPPPQCTSVFQAAESEAQWKEWNNRIGNITNKLNAGTEAAAANYEKDIIKFQKTNNVSLIFNQNPLHGKAEKLVHAYIAQAAALQQDAQLHYDKNYSEEKERLQSEHSKQIAKIHREFKETVGEGKMGDANSYCKQINHANNLYLQLIGGLNDGFNARFSEPLRILHIEIMYWSQLMPLSASMREQLYYANAIAAISPIQMVSEIIKPCEENKKANVNPKEEEALQPYCPISFRFKIGFVKATGDCNKLDIEVEIEGLVFNMERDFIRKRSTLAFGVGASVDMKKDMVPQLVQHIVETGGAGAGVKVQGFIEMGGDGFTDGGIRGEAGVEGVGTDKGDIKITGKIGVNSGVDISTTPAVEAIGKFLNETIVK